MTRPDVCIAGGGIIGLSLARSLARSGLGVVVCTSEAPMAEASHAAAGMLAVDDPDNPSQLLPLSRLSRALYPTFLEELAEDSGQRVAAQTQRTVQIVSRRDAARVAPRAPMDLLPELTMQPDDEVLLLEEQSLDPRELASALVRAVGARGPELRTHSRVLHVRDHGGDVTIETTTGTLVAGSFVDCTGAWSLSTSLAPGVQVRPRKGQMLTILTPPTLAKEEMVLRSEEVYLVPRMHGARAGQCVIGATVEDVGFDRAVHAADLERLLHRAAHLLPEVRGATVLDSWAGLRPATEDLLPVLGRIPSQARGSRLFVASGHYRNGILLAPATAAVMTDLLLGREPAVALDHFSPGRLQSVSPVL